VQAQRLSHGGQDAHSQTGSACQQQTVSGPQFSEQRHRFHLGNRGSEGISRGEYRTKKFGSWERSQELDAKMVAVGESEGIHFAFDRTERTPNTLDAHRLIWLAEKHGVQDAVVEALFRGYFTEGRDISNQKTLIDVVAEAGLDRHQAEGVLNSHEGLEAIKEAAEQSRRIGVEGVPFFIVNGEITLSGAPPPEAFLEAFGKAVGGT
jgi:predicted DsbA family dithiol-disulfide isomerase